jgi:hypothetical protein
MENFKEKLKDYLYPNIKWVYFCALASIILATVLYHHPQWPLLVQILLIVFCLYSFVIFCFSLPQFVGEVFTLLNKNKYISRFLNDLNVRMFVTLYLNALINSLFAFMNLFFGIMYDSTWQIAISCYYFVLIIARFYLLSYLNREDLRNGRNSGENMLADFQKYEMTGVFLLVILIPIVWILVQMLEENQSYNYNGFMLYVMAAFNVYVWGMVIYGQMMYGKIDNPLMTANRAIALACALMSVLCFETAWLNHYTISIGVIDREVIIALTGMVVCLSIFGVGVHMVYRGWGILSLNRMPRKYRKKVSLKEKHRIRKEIKAQHKAQYEAYMKEHWGGRETENYERTSDNWRDRNNLRTDYSSGGKES